MADLIIKPLTGAGNTVRIQDQAGGAILTSENSGATLGNSTQDNITRLGTVTTGTIGGSSVVDTSGAITTTGAIHAPGVPVFLTRKHITSQFDVTSTQTASDLTYTYTYPASHKLWIFGGFTCVGTSGGSFHSHWVVYVDGGRVFSPDQHDTPPGWWHQGFAFTTGDLSSSQHVITVTGHAQQGNWYAVSGADVSQINYMAIPN